MTTVMTTTPVLARLTIINPCDVVGDVVETIGEMPTAFDPYKPLMVDYAESLTRSIDTPVHVMNDTPIEEAITLYWQALLDARHVTIGTIDSSQTEYQIRLQCVRARVADQYGYISKWTRERTSTRDALHSLILYATIFLAPLEHSEAMHEIALEDARGSGYDMTSEHAALSLYWKDLGTHGYSLLPAYTSIELTGYRSVLGALQEDVISDEHTHLYSSIDRYFDPRWVDSGSLGDEHTEWYDDLFLYDAKQAYLSQVAYQLENWTDTGYEASSFHAFMTHVNATHRSLWATMVTETILLRCSYDEATTTMTFAPDRGPYSPRFTWRVETGETRFTIPKIGECFRDTLPTKPTFKASDAKDFFTPCDDTLDRVARVAGRDALIELERFCDDLVSLFGEALS